LRIRLSSRASSTTSEWDADAPGSVREVKELYDNWADSYEQTLTEWGWEAPKKVASMVARHGCLTGAIVDVGCGTGMVGEELRAAGCVGDLVGLDISKQSLSKARAKTFKVDEETQRVYTSTICADLTQGVFASGVVYSSRAAYVYSPKHWNGKLMISLVP